MMSKSGLRSVTGGGHPRCFAWRGVLLAAAIALPGGAAALEFVPTDFEWSTWPEYCRARYTVSGAGAGSKFANRVSPSVVADWHRKLDAVWYGLHHYCAGIVIFEQARHKKDKFQAQHAFEQVVGESTFTLARASETHPMYAKILALRGRALFELGQTKEAFGDFERAIQLHPKQSDAYMASALLLRRMGKREDARETLQRGLDNSGGGTAEMHYLLGLILAELKDYEGAMEHAKVAYTNGYPLPGLKRKLQAAGHWAE